MRSENRPCVFRTIDYTKAKPGLQAGAASSEESYRAIRALVIEIDEHNALIEKFCTK
jgi:hypothetical protein